MDSRIGLDYIVENHEYVGKLGAALETNNETVKKQVFELLSALCAYSPEGYKRALSTLEHYKTLKDERYKVKIVVNELSKTTSIDYQISLLAFINCVIISAPCLQDRIRIRNEFIGLNLVPALNNLREKVTTSPDLGVQLDVFDEQRECDEEQSLQGSDGINLSSHLDVFYAIFRRVADTPQEIPFLSILQHLLRIDPKESISEIIWDTTETLVHRATLLENSEDSTRLLRSPSTQKFACPNCRCEATSPSRKQSIPPVTANIPLPPAPPPPPPMAGGNLLPAPPAPPPNPNNLNAKLNVCNRSKTPEPVICDSVSRLPQQETPVPKSKMKTINWNKIPPNKVVGKHNIWSLVADSHQNSPMADLDWAEMEGLFCQQQTQNGQGSPKLGRDNGNEVVERKTRKENLEITLLDGKRSLNVNIFLKQFRSSNDDIIHLIKEGEHDDIGAEKLRGLLKILPEVDELDMLKSFDGDKNRLGNAEKFLLQLIQVPNYKLRIESMLLKEEFAANLIYLEPSINSMIFAGDDLMNNKLLQEVLYMVVVAGNFLNSGGYAGNAAGVKLSSLQKLTDIRANKPGMNLIHYVALQADKRNKNLLTFSSQLSTLENASKISVEQLNNEINALDTRIKKIKKQVELPATDSDIKIQMIEFIQSAERELIMLQRGMKEIESLRLQLADFFCEDPSSFKLEECFKVFQIFCEKFRQAVAENDRRRIQEEQALFRRKQREDQLASKRRQLSQTGSSGFDSESSFILDSLQYDMKGSPAMTRRRVGSFNSNGDHSKREDGQSPDITPNGSLRRRRSRVLSEDDEGNLMDFLRSTGNDLGTRERKSASYGSLDRSWSRRARTGSSNKKRSDLLNVDFGVDRERPNSPSPLAEIKPIPPPAVENKPRISREWRQKIESWLQANEQDDKYSDDYRRKNRRIVNNRRSLENDSDNDRKLDPLPEEKTTISPITSNDSYKRVYSDWKPSSTLEKTDVVGTIEAIEDAQVPTTKDKSAWRKSNLNVSNSTEDTDPDLRRIRRQSSRDNSTSALHSILEEDKRKSVIQSLGDRSASDRLQIYIRRSDETPPTNVSPIIEEKIPNVPRRIRRSVVDNSKNNIEIDSDNIETPPPIRKSFSNESNTIVTPCRKLPRALNNDTTTTTDNKHLYELREQKKIINPVEQEILGDGQFDRHSSARRTRRYKRPVDYNSGTDEQCGSPEITETDSKIDLNKDNKELRLKRWQEKLNSPDRVTTNVPSQNIVSRIGKIGRHLSSINQEDVMEAIKSLKSPTETPERVWTPLKEIGKDIVVFKASNPEFNDEGFEETQSLVSDTPSHGKDSFSSCNDTVECRTKNENPKTNSVNITGSDSLRRKTNTTKIQKIINRNHTGLDRTRSMRNSPSNLISAVIPKRTNSLRKTESQNSVERSNSRGSLRSSRSSLNSVISTNTVKKMPIKKVPSIELTSPKKSLIQNSSPEKTLSRVPASRSSSSGSSIGPSIRKTPIKTNSTNFKENQNQINKTTSARIFNSTQKRDSPVYQVSSSRLQDKRISSPPVPKTSGFMRPTTASSTKVAITRK